MFNAIPTIDLTNVVPYTLVISSTIMEDKIVVITEYRYKCIGIQQCAEETLLKCKTIRLVVSLRSDYRTSSQRNVCTMYMYSSFNKVKIYKIKGSEKSTNQ